jgi:hypothetical protein
METSWGQVHLVDERPVAHQEVELEAVDVDPLAGDKPAVGPLREEAGARIFSQARRGKVSKA